MHSSLPGICTNTYTHTHVLDLVRSNICNLFHVDSKKVIYISYCSLLHARVIGYLMSADFTCPSPPR